MKQIAKSLLLYLFSILIVACSTQRYSVKNSHSSYKHNYALSESGKLKVKIPAGWFKARDNDKKLIDLWLVKDDYLASIKFIPIVIHNSLSSNNESAVSYSKTYIKTSLGRDFKKFITETENELNSKKVSFYKIMLNDERIFRCAVFEKGNSYYECILNYVNPLTNEEINELFKIQNEVIINLIPGQVL